MADDIGTEDAETPNVAMPPRSRDPKVFVLERELAEVHLLLDNVSANPNTTVSERSAEIGGEGDLPPDWLDKVCEITWPSSGSEEERADDAALLIRTKDHLNRLSYPASGSTIAFTTLVTQCDLTRALPGAALLRRLGATWNQAGAGDGGAPLSPTRRSLAETAYPDLIIKARSFGEWMRWISWGLLFVLVASCLLSWYVAYGNAQLSELRKINESLAELDKTIADAELPKDKNGAPATGAAGGAGAQQDEAPPPGAAGAAGIGPNTPFVRYCERNPYTGAAQAQTCTQLYVKIQERHRVKCRLRQWLTWPMSTTCPQAPPPPNATKEDAGKADAGEAGAGEAGAAKPGTGNAAAGEPDPPRAAVGKADAAKAEAAKAEAKAAAAKEDADKDAAYLIDDAPARASLRANILGSAVLPFFYGLLGAAAAVIRTISKKIRASLLSPRELTLSLQQLALGAVTGACIGLFIASPGGSGKSETLFEPVGLSGPAISFIAGFGVDAVFQALEELIRRVFNVNPNAAAPATTVPTRTVVVRRPGPPPPPPPPGPPPSGDGGAGTTDKSPPG